MAASMIDTHISDQHIVGGAEICMTLEELMQIWGVNGFKHNDNANLDDKNPETMHKRIADYIASKGALMLLPPRLADMHLNGDIHIHDLEYFTSRPFCQNLDLRYFIYYGLIPDGVGNRLPVAGPSKKAEVVVLHSAKALGCDQTCFAGGQGFQNWNLFIAPFLEGLSYDEIKQLMQMFIYEMGQMIVARGSQAVFSSVQLIPGVPLVWRDVKAVYQGQISERTYKEFEREVRLSFKAFMEIIRSGDYWGKPFNFPKPEISIMKEFLDDDWDKPLTRFEDVGARMILLDICRVRKGLPTSEDIEMVDTAFTWEDAPSYRDLYLLAFKAAAENGTPYFDNHIPEYRQSEGGMSCYQCCSYMMKSDDKCDVNFYKKLHFIDGMHFDDMGACQVVSLNLPRAALEAMNRVSNEFAIMDAIAFIHRRMDDAVEIFKIKREFVHRAPLPFARQTPVDPNDPNKRAPPLVNIEALGYVIGVVGLNEMVQALTGKQMHESSVAAQLGIMVMKDLDDYAEQLCRKHGMKIALSRTPAETTAQRFAVLDLKDVRYTELAMNIVKGDINAALSEIHNCADLPIYYSNGTHLHVGARDEKGNPISIIDRMNFEQQFFPIVDGGNIFHIFLGEKSPDPEALMEFALNIARTTDIGYFTFTKDMTVCKNCHKVTPGLKASCPGCGSNDIDHMSRITGYLQAVSGWNNAKRQELKDRNRIETVS